MALVCSKVALALGLGLALALAEVMPLPVVMTLAPFLLLLNVTRILMTNKSKKPYDEAYSHTTKNRVWGVVTELQLIWTLCTQMVKAAAHLRRPRNRENNHDLCI